MGEPPAMSSTIDGVNVHALRAVRNERGTLLDIARSDEPWFPGFGQVYVTSTYDGVVRAWYRHRNQTDVLAPGSGAIRFVAYDDREDSATHGHVVELLLGEETPYAVVVPPGVWHGFRAEGGTALVVHCNTVPFRVDDPDEERLPSDAAEIPYRWPT